MSEFDTIILKQAQFCLGQTDSDINKISPLKNVCQWRFHVKSTIDKGLSIVISRENRYWQMFVNSDFT